MRGEKTYGSYFSLSVILYLIARLKCILQEFLQKLWLLIFCSTFWYKKLCFAFDQFLEEARNNASEEHYTTIPQYRVEAHRNQSDEATKNRKSWKRSLFSCWKAEKKSDSTLQPPTTDSYIPEPKRGHVSTSGPIYGSGGGFSCQPRRPTSAPLKTVSHLTNEVENEIPYMRLDNPHGVQSYGPVYLVT